MPHLWPNLVGSDHEHRAGNGVRDIDDPKVATAESLTEGDSSPLAAGSILEWTGHHVGHLNVRNTVTVDMRLAGFWVDVEPKLHTARLAEHQGFGKYVRLVSDSGSLGDRQGTRRSYNDTAAGEPGAGTALAVAA